MAPQAAIVDGTSVSFIPGGPALTASPNLIKATVPTSWATWSHAYTGPVFQSDGGLTEILTLPPLTHAFRVDVEPGNFTPFNAVFPGFGAPVMVAATTPSGETAFGCYATAGETLTKVVVTVPVGALGFAMGEFALAQADLSVPALEPGMLRPWLFCCLALASGCNVGARRKRNRLT